MTPEVRELLNALEAYRREDIGERSNCFCVHAPEHWPSCARLLAAIEAVSGGG